jgi:hypothetical protein
VIVVLQNPIVMVQAFLYALLFYKTAPGPSDLGSFLVFYLLLVPMSVLNLMRTHWLKEMVANRAKKA